MTPKLRAEQAAARIYGLCVERALKTNTGTVTIGDVAAALAREFEDAAHASEERARRAEQALEPFARFDVPAACGTRDDSVFYGSNVTGTPTDLTVGDFRRARAVLRPPPAAMTTTKEQTNE